MGIRTAGISKSVLKAIFKDDDTAQKRSLLSFIFNLFSLFQLILTRFCGDVFRRLRTEAWGIDEEEYRESFRGGKLNAVGDLGYSGSTFFTTPNSKYLIKSLPRRFEYTFFTNDLFGSYVAHAEANPTSLLVRITDFLESRIPALGVVLGTAPPNHVVMENLLCDTPADSRETYDLKPSSYFFPERDIANGNLAPASVKDRLVDEMPDKIRIHSHDFESLVSVLEKDTELLSSHNAVDYSLFLVRYPPPETVNESQGSWRTGVMSRDGKWMYRAVVLDFFWAKHKSQPMVMTSLVDSFNLFAKKGPMSITADPKEYKQRFLKMVKDYVEVEAE